MKAYLPLAAGLFVLATPAAADQSNFSFGPVINDFGAIAKVDTDVPLPANSDYKIVFDVKSAKAGERSTGLDAVARLMNMLAANGVPMSKIHPAVVLHNDAVWEVVSDARGLDLGGEFHPFAHGVGARGRGRDHHGTCGYRQHDSHLLSRPSRHRSEWVQRIALLPQHLVRGHR